ncbi:MAG: chromosome segregation protein SMC [Clostridium sp.]|uniref:chromosome segregation protein SMC n=1 Tax=Clostridium sp. TaxID=1506 RepID=UPI002908AF58|nr:chromosome segregation protein SMC [Clostridium sp.]MDU7336950.1 chromosome segregation protein SMC [Clostridium sp.]
MLLKSLELQGFKTFPDKTVLQFDRGITAVVGPNGSGKSNVSDSIRWVLGEQSARVLRCSKMEDVIFGGTHARKAQGYAEVTLTFDNTDRQLAFDSDQVAVTRRYYRSGESEYMLNKNTVRLRDIHELFMDTGMGRDGYSMIGQGKIDSIVAARSEDRREIFEEAAGISRFRYRKGESERRLQQAQENLVRLHDIFSELEARVGPLREQAEKAKQFLEYSEEKRTLEIGLWLNTLGRSGQILRDYEDKLLLARSQQEEIDKKATEIERQIEENYQAVNACTSRMDEARALASAKEEEAARKDGEAAVLENDREHNRQNQERIVKELEQSSLSDEDLRKEMDDKQSEMLEKDRFVQAQQEEVEAVSKRLEELKGSMEQYSGQMEEQTRLLAQLTADVSQVKIREMTAVTAVTEIELRRTTVQQALENREKLKQELEAKEQECSAFLQKAEDAIAALTNTTRGFEMRLDSRQKRLEEARRNSEQLRLDAGEQARRVKLLEEMERNLEGFAHSVKTVMKEVGHGSLSGVHGPVSRLLQVPAEYAVAVETALGASMQNIVVETEQDAKRAIELLKKKDSGRATFLPISTIHGNLLQEQGLADCLGFVGVAFSVCGCDAKYAGIMRSLLGRIVIAEDLDSAVAIAKRYSYRFRVVTLDGQVVNAGGSLTGGSLAKNAGLLSRAAQMEKAKKQALLLSQKAEEAEAALKAAQAEYSSAQASLVAAQAELSTAKEDRVHLQAEHGRIKAERQSLENGANELVKEQKQAEQRLTQLQEQKEQALREAKALEEQILTLKESVSQITGDREELEKRYQALTDALQEARMTVLSAQKEKEALAAAAVELENRRQNFSGVVQRLNEELSQLGDKDCEIKEQAEQLRLQAKELRNTAVVSRESVEGIAKQRAEYETKASQLRSLEREQSSSRDTIGQEMARLEERRANVQKEYDEIISRLWEEYELTRREAEEICPRLEDVSVAKRRLNELKGKIKALGTVNVAAMEEYKEVAERYEFMKEQIGDVEKSRDELRKLISELTQKMQELFLQRFEKIRQHFSETFRSLFGGGSAELTLSQPEDVLTSGIEIAVQPPGKIVAHLESLSGGEKALVAIALYFAIMKVNPPPFCVLDEIEAALDDVNVDRFAGYLRGMNQNTQFIVITHRRGTMEEADVLYGVTMQDEGVSKLLELRASEMEQKLGIG